MLKSDCIHIESLCFELSVQDTQVDFHENKLFYVAMSSQVGEQSIQQD
jgi:hypothetical protein